MSARIPPDEDKRYFFDGAAYAMAYGPWSEKPLPRDPEKAKRVAKNRKKRARRRERRIAEVAAAPVYEGQKTKPNNDRMADG